MSESRYQIIERIAAGGMAEVYRGESAGIEGFRKKVAIKRVLPKLSSNREFINMFLDEARLCAYLNHSKCVQVFDIGQGNGSHFIVMEYVDGADLKHVLEYLGAHRQQMRVEVACLIAMGIAEGLAYAHQACDAQGRPLEIVHRDISPHNVLMTRFGEVKLVDFGLAKASSHLTAEDEDIVKGKFGYLAPEVTLGQGADKRVDIFAAGILLWEMLAGRRLFLGNSDVETFKLVQAANIPDPRESRRDIPDELIRVLARALARDRDQRYQTADELARDLSAVLVGLPRPASYQDIGALVREAAVERDQHRRAEGAATEGMIGDLIIDALHDFSGELDNAEDRVSRLGTQGVDVGAGGSFEDPSQWGLDALFEEPAPAYPAAPPPPRGQAAMPPTPGAQAAPRAGAPPPPRRPPPPPRERVQKAPEKKDGPFWRRWFGS
jgi:serine/threonine-protein kinase